MNSGNSGDQWKPDLYDGKHSFVWKLGASVIEQLAPRAGERILDLGCGTGQLTAQISETGADVIGLDNSESMIEEARRLYPTIEFQLADAHDFEVEKPLDALFSNAALHWIQDPPRVADCMSHALKPQGRLAVEFGGHGNVACLAQSLESACQAVLGQAIDHPWYFPTIAEFASLLEHHGLEVTQAALIDRPTPLDGEAGLRNWVRMFGEHWLRRIQPEDQERFLELVEDNARATLLREDGWYADYRRLRVTARRNS